MPESGSGYNPFLKLPNLNVITKNNIIGNGSHGEVSQHQISLASEGLTIPIINKVVKSFDMSKGRVNFDHEVTILEHLKMKGNKIVPHIYSSESDRKVGSITMEKIMGTSADYIAPDPEGNVVLDLGMQLAESIHTTYLDGAVDIDPKINSFRGQVLERSAPLCL